MGALQERDAEVAYLRQEMARREEEFKDKVADATESLRSVADWQRSKEGLSSCRLVFGTWRWFETMMLIEAIPIPPPENRLQVEEVHALWQVESEARERDREEKANEVRGRRR